MKPESIEVTRDPLTGVQIRIGVMGSAGGAAEPAVSKLCWRLGQAVAKRGGGQELHRYLLDSQLDGDAH